MADKPHWITTTTTGDGHTYISTICSECRYETLASPLPKRCPTCRLAMTGPIVSRSRVIPVPKGRRMAGW